jgi:hypothetical protein
MKTLDSKLQKIPEQGRQERNHQNNGKESCQDAINLDRAKDFQITAEEQKSPKEK